MVAGVRGAQCRTQMAGRLRFSTATLNIVRFSEWYLILYHHSGARIFVWLLDLWHFCAPMCLLCLTVQFSDLSGYIILKRVLLLLLLLLLLLIGSVIQFHILLIHNS